MRTWVTKMSYVDMKKLNTLFLLFGLNPKDFVLTKQKSVTLLVHLDCQNVIRRYI